MKTITIHLLLAPDKTPIEVALKKSDLAEKVGKEKIISVKVRI